MENEKILMLDEKKDPDHSRCNQQQMIRSAKAVLVLCPVESVAKPENIEAVAKIKNPGEGK
jgi:hypothetical protein